MKQVLYAAARNLASLIRPQKVVFEGWVLPPVHMRTGGSCFREHADFLSGARNDVQKLQELCGLKETSRILDIGCGPCRLPTGILQTMGAVRRYCGVDVKKSYTDWGTKYVTKAHPQFTFHHINVFNERYNRQSSVQQQSLYLPFEEESFDIIYLYSVFSHLLQEDIEAYLQEFARLLAPGGSVFLTAFVEEGVEDVTENPEGYGDIPWKGPLHCVRYNKNLFNQLLKHYGFDIRHFAHQSETNLQNAYVLTRN